MMERRQSVTKTGIRLHSDPSRTSMFCCWRSPDNEQPLINVQPGR